MIFFFQRKNSGVYFFSLCVCMCVFMCVTQPQTLKSSLISLLNFQDLRINLRLVFEVVMGITSLFQSFSLVLVCCSSRSVCRWVS